MLFVLRAPGAELATTETFEQEGYEEVLLQRAIRQREEDEATAEAGRLDSGQEEVTKPEQVM